MSRRTRQSSLLVSGIVMQPFHAHSVGNLTNSNSNTDVGQVVDEAPVEVAQNSVEVLMKLLFPGEEIYLQCPVTKLLGNSEKVSQCAFSIFTLPKESYEPYSNGKAAEVDQQAHAHTHHHAKGDITHSMTGLLAITSYRILFCGQLKDKSVVDQIPMAFVNKISKVGGQTSSKEEAYRLEINSKDGKVLRAIMPRAGGVRKAVYKRLKERANDYCYTYHTKTIEALGGVDPGWDIYNMDEENARMGVGSEWRITEANAAYTLCPTYPARLTVPAAANDALLQSVGGYRTKQRLPILSYYHRNSSASITRASQPKPGISRSRCTEDEQYVKIIRMAASKPQPEANGSTPEHAPSTSSAGPQLYIIDARPYANAVGNMAKGAGWEMIDNYEACKIEFCGVENIHVMRESLHKLREACEESDAGWYKALEQSQWYNHMSTVLSGAIRIARLIDSGIPTLVHCSDGWDRTAQLTCLSMLMLDPYYRTIEGFMKMVDREWSQMGHQFALRCGHDEGKEDQRAPIFFQFLETVYQFSSQYPTDFEFNSGLLSFLHHHCNACLFGTFMANCERARAEIKTKTRSIWSYL